MAQAQAQAQAQGTLDNEALCCDAGDVLLPFSCIHF